MKKSIDDQACDWLEAYEELGPRERKKFEEWLAEDVSHVLAFSRLYELYYSNELDLALERLRPMPLSSTKSSTKTTWMHLFHFWRYSLSLKTVKYIIPLALSCCVIIAVGIKTTFDLKDAGSTTNETLTYTSKRLQKLERQLSDGSFVYLNADSKLRYRSEIKRRYAELENGQVVFNIVSDENRPFVVSVGETLITVVGTKFDIEHVGGRVAISVFEGKVKVAAKDSFVLAKGESAIITDYGKTIEIGNFHHEEGPDWVQGWINVNEIPLGHFVTKLQRYSNKTILVSPSVAQNFYISGRFKLSETEKNLRLVAEINDLDFVVGNFTFQLKEK